MKTAILMPIALWLASCGTEPASAVEISVPAQLPLPLVCPARDTLGLTAELLIGGHEPCQLTVDPDTLETSGSCPNIQGGSKRPAALIYRMTPSGGSLVTVGVWLTTVDLCHNSKSAKLSFVDDGENGVLYVQQNSLPNALTGNNTPPPPSCTWALDEAREWLGYLRTAGQALQDTNLDCDDNSESNLQEACNGSLNTSQCP